MDRRYLALPQAMGVLGIGKPVPMAAYWEPVNVSTAESLRRVMHRNTALRVAMVANAYYDLKSRQFAFRF